MQNLIAVLLMAILTVFVANAQECMKEAWVQEEANTQGGGFYWIPSKKTNANPDIAILLAKSDAMIVFLQKCGPVLVSKLAFNEVCTEKPGFWDKKVYTAHVRLTYTQADCNLARQLAKEGNPEETWKYTNKELFAIAKEARELGLR